MTHSVLFFLIRYDKQKSIRSTSYYARSRIESTPVHVPEQRPYPSYTTPVAVPGPCFAVAACPYVVKRVLNARNVKGSPRRAHTFEVLVCSCSVLQCSNCFSASFQCLRGWFTRIMSNREFLFTTVSRKTARKLFVVWQKRGIPSAKPAS